MNWLRRELTCGHELRQSRVNNPSGFTAFTHLPLHRGGKNDVHPKAFPSEGKVAKRQRAG